MNDDLTKRLLCVKAEFSQYSKEAAAVQEAIDVLKARSEWREAVLDELAISCIDYPSVGTAPREILRGIIAVREAMAVSNAEPKGEMK